MTGYEATDLFEPKDMDEQCTPQEMSIKNVRLAHAYVPYQKFCTLYSASDSLKCGTIFPELDMPYN